jgi:hypothetical protein
VLTWAIGESLPKRRRTVYAFSRLAAYLLVLLLVLLFVVGIVMPFLTLLDAAAGSKR